MDKAAAKVPAKVRFYRFRNVLKEKLAGGAGGPAISAEMLEQASASLDKMSEDYPDWAAVQVSELRAMHGRMVDTPETRRKNYDAIRALAQEIKGQGATFGYPLVSTFALSLQDCTGPGAPLTDNHVEVVKAHVDSIGAVIKDRVKGNGGQIGKELTMQLKAAIERHSMSA
jgi:hypothetical protein